MICGDIPSYGWVYGWLFGWVGWYLGSCQITKNWINLDLIEIIQFCLKIYDLWRHSHTWVNGWAHVKSLKSKESWSNRDNLILDILWTFLLKPLQLFTRLFLPHAMKLWQGNIFTPVCHSVHRGGVCHTPWADTLGRHSLGQTLFQADTPRQTPPPGQTPPRQTPPWADIT